MFRFLLPTLLLVCLSCKKEQLHSTDFTEENLFTNGIEGPAVNKDGKVFAVNFKEEGTIGKIGQDGKGEIYLRLPKGSVGNGIRFNNAGYMFIADYAGHKVYRFSPEKHQLEVWAQDSTMNQPNDLVIGPKNRIYLSDPNWNKGTGKLWLITPNRQIRLLEENMGTTNGIELSPDNNVLYVNESVQRTVWKYQIKSDGTLANKEKFISFEYFGLDGMRCDEKGNLYIARYDKGTVVIVSPKGRIIEEVILKGKKPTNLTFGGEDLKTCYVTMADRGCLEQFKAPFKGKKVI
ncbi:SMP-30/gluconolactonase/LRE family protein [Flavobacteriaceae bacterium KMM 6898]|nr:SMP-30/gluconolactonase/LRE family protein [Flavobacteriaceae bacterium KMM 6898]